MRECARCGWPVPYGSGRNSDAYHGKLIHGGFCPTPPEREAEPVHTSPFKIRQTLRAFCWLNLDHNRCSGIQVTERSATVCSCDCHKGE